MTLTALKVLDAILSHLRDSWCSSLCEGVISAGVVMFSPNMQTYSASNSRGGLGGSTTNARSIDALCAKLHVDSGGPGCDATVALQLELAWSTESHGIELK